MRHQHHIHKMLLHGNHRIRNVEPGSEDPVVVSVIYVTAAKTFDGPVGGYKTLDGSDLGEDGAPPAPTNASSPSQTEDAQNSGQDSRSPTSATPNAQQMSMGEPTQISAQLSQQTLKSEQNLNPSPTNRETDAAGSFSPTFSTKFVKSASEASATDPSIATSRSAGAPSVRESSGAVPSFTDQSAKTGTASSVPTLATTNKTQKMSGGAAAGLVIGILVIIGALFLLFLCLRRKKNMKKLYGKTDDEKAPLGSQAGVGRVPSTNSVRTTASAPRLSLRPVTQFLPDLGGRGKNSNMSPTADGPTHDALNIPNENFSEKKGPSDQGNEQTNPFGAHAEVNDGTAPPVQIKQATNPFGNQAEDVHSSGFAEPPPVQAPAPLRVRTPTPDPSSANGVVAAAILGGARDERYKTPNQLNVSPSRSISPVSSVAGTEFSTTSISPNHPVQSLPQSNVHRVQLDFKPSMDDELGLQAGQLVRLLHEYDDGWALCIRLDRSQQGVAPRTCLSARPVKPRPAGNNRGPLPPRGPPPPAMFGPGLPRPLSPANGRGSPNPYGREPRAISPAPAPAQRSMSPGPYGGGPQRPIVPAPGRKRRSNSAGQVRERRMSPPGPSPMNPNAGSLQRVPTQLQVPSAFRDHPQNMQRKPVPGQAI